MRGVTSIPDDRLVAVLRDHYGFTLASLDALSLGFDARAALYRADTDGGESYFVKVRSGAMYESSWQVPRYLRDRGATQVVAPLPSQQGRLWLPVERWSIAVYPFIEGVSGWEPGLTADQWRAAGAALRQVHHVSPPPLDGRDLRVETFDPGGYIRWAREFEARLLRSEGGSEIERELRAEWLNRRVTIDEALVSLERLGAALQRENRPRVVCHADLHPGNMIRTRDGAVFLIDWEDVMLAPKERDFLFINDNPVAAAAQQDTSPFFHGYGHAAIDWASLTYYLWERAVQDINECARVVYIQQDIAEETRAAELRLLKAILNVNESGSIASARAAAAYLPGSASAHHASDKTSAS